MKTTFLKTYRTKYNTFCLFIDPSVHVISWLCRLQGVRQVGRSTPTLDTIKRDWKSVSPQGLWYITTLHSAIIMLNYSETIQLNVLHLLLIVLSLFFPLVCILRMYECNKRCRCNPQMCTNRLVQHGLQVRLQLFKTQNKGWGIRCLDDIAKGSFVCIYAGNPLRSRDIIWTFSLFKRKSIQCLVLPKLLALKPKYTLSAWLSFHH